ncbi:MAG: PQ-loop repeat-containing protein [Actinomycetota bacterium]|nr:PQ-loop repeat-containing protein [Actinomycetota bacterium]
MPRDTIKRRRPTRVDVESIKPRVEQAVFGFGFLNPMLALPQIYNIFALKHVAGLSLITIAAALVMSLLWVAYGALSKQLVVWATSAVWVILNGATLIGVAMFAH